MRNKTNIYQRIQKGMKENDRQMLQLIRRFNKNGEGFRPVTLSLRGHHAIDRLMKAGKIRYRRNRRYEDRYWLKGGYWVRDRK